MAAHMEVDSDPLIPMVGISSNLKRCNSAPMINMLDDSSSVVGSVSKQSLDDCCKPITNTSLGSVTSLSLSTPSSGFRPVDTRVRSRHYSTSSLAAPSHSSNNVSTPIKVPNRVHQIKQDEEVQTNVHREIKHERETQSAMQMSQSWEEHFSLEDTTMSTNEAHKNRPRSLSESLHIFTSGFPVASSPSPTRVGKQCFSPSMQAPVILNGNFNFSPSPSPSPTRRVARRSLSPIVTLKPSLLSHKRKLEGDADSGFSQPKRIFTGNSGSLLSPATLHIGSPSQVLHNNLRLGLDINNIRQHTSSSLSTGSYDDSASEHSSVGTISSTATATSSAACGAFSPLTTTDNYSTTTTDSESDMFDCNSNNNNNNRTIDSSSTNSSCNTSLPR